MWKSGKISVFFNALRVCCVVMGLGIMWHGSAMAACTVRNFACAKGLDGYEVISLGTTTGCSDTFPQTKCWSLNGVAQHEAINCSGCVSGYSLFQASTYCDGVLEYYNQCQCTTPCTSKSNTSSTRSGTESCTQTCTIANGTCTYTGATRSYTDTCNGKYTSTGCSSAGESCSGCSSWGRTTNGTCSGGTISSITCFNGYYKSGNSCVKCDAGYYCTGNTRYNCPANSYCPAGSSSATACSTVSFTDSGSESCTVSNGSGTKTWTRTCYRTTSSQNSDAANDCSGSASCTSKTYSVCNVTTCDTGYSVDSKGYSCVANTYTCSEGNYLSGVSCVKCESGYYCPGGTWTYNGGVQGRTACTSWRANTNTNGNTGSTGTSACVCKAGYYLSGSTCTACAAGKYKSANSNATSCTAADSGYYVSTTAATAQSACTSWRANTNTGGLTGSSSTSACVCKAGYYLSGSTCTACAAGTYKSLSSNATSCLVADSGYYVSSTGATSQSACTSWRANTNTNGATGSTSTSACVCKAGYYLNGSTCTACAAGKYKSANSNATSCSNVSANCYTTGTGSTSSCPNSCPSNSSSSAGSDARADCSCNAGYGGNAATGSCTICSAGYYKSSAGNTSCSNCGKGYYCTGGTARAACPAGTYGSTDNLTTSACTGKCAGGRYGSSTAQTASTCNGECTAGYYCPAGSTSATQNGCPRNSSSAAGSDARADCSCNAGYGGDATTGSCTVCSAGYYKSSAGNTSCSNCGAGYYCTGGTARAACPAGTYGSTANLTTSACTGKCAGGRYGSGTAQTASTCNGACTAGYYCPAGSTSSKQNACPSNSSSAAGSDAVADCLCNAGYGGDASSGSACTACACGTYKANAGNLACIQTSAGYYAAGTGNTGQTKSSANYYAAKGACSQTACPSGSSCAAGSDARADCSCNAGYGGDATTGSCTICSAGYYKSSAGNTSCSKVSANCYTTGTGSTSSCPNSCPSGSSSPAGSDARADCSCNAGYGGDATTGSCTACACGYYKGSAGNAACTKTTAGYYATGTGNTGQTKASAGSYAAAGACLQTLCPSGSSSTAGSDAVADCSCIAGYGGDASGGSSCTICSAGYYKSSAGNTSCSKVSANCYASGTGSTTACPSSCPTNSSSAAGSDSREDCSCNAGYGGDARTSSCTVCSPGYYKSSAGNTSCSMCSAGHYCTGGTHRADCPAGTYGTTNYETSSACTGKCEAGTYSTGGQTACTVCTNKPANSSYTSATGNTSASCPWSCNTGFQKNSAGTACVGISYTVKYDANGGSGTTESSSHTYGTAKALTSNGFTNGVKKFLGWSTSSTATSATYTNGQSVSNLTSTSGGTVTLYAVWGTCTACAAGTGATCTLSAPKGVCTYTTDCKTGYEMILNSGMYNPSCLAKCNAITLNANGGTAGSVATLYKKTDATGYFTDNKCITEYATTTAVKPTRSGYSFRGFYVSTPADVSATESNGVARYIDHTGAATNTGNSWTVNAASTLYAGWAKNCAPGTQATCTLELGQNTSYTTGCNTGYNIKSGSGAYNPVCQANTYTVKYDINCPSGATCSSAPSSTSCSYGTTCTFSSISSTALYAGGYNLIGWGSSATGAGATSGSNLTSTNGGTVTRYAIWSKCLAGTYHPAAIGTAANVCTSASKGYYVSSDGAAAQTACAKGKYSDQDGATSCESVDAGCYADTTGSTTSCPKGVDAGCYADATGSTTSCPKTCPAMTYSTGGQEKCTLCMNKPANSSYTSATGNTSASCPWSCSAGYYGSSANGDTLCADCGTGKYCTGGTSRADCPAGTYGSTANLKTNACSGKCAVGKYSTDGAASCLDVDQGCYADATGSTKACPKSCPSGYPNSAAGSDAITDCYSNSKSRAWTGEQGECLLPVGCSDVTCDTCSKPACAYVAYSNDAGTGDGTIKSGCSSNNETCLPTAKSVKASSGSYVNGLRCPSCSSLGDGSFTESAANNTGGSEVCFKSCSRACTQQSVPTGVNSVSHGGTSTTGTHYYGGSCSAAASTCSLTINNCKSGYYMMGSGATASCELCSSLANGFYPNSANANSNGLSACYTNDLTGKYVKEKYASTATDCACGSYKGKHTVEYGGTSSCTETTFGHYAAKGASSQTKTDAGYYALAGACEQTPISAGCYGGAGSGVACPNKCPENTYRSKTGGKTIDDCSICPPGFENSAAGSTSDTMCYQSCSSYQSGGYTYTPSNSTANYPSECAYTKTCTTPCSATANTETKVETEYCVYGGENTLGCVTQNAEKKVTKRCSGKYTSGDCASAGASCTGCTEWTIVEETDCAPTESSTFVCACEPGYYRSAIGIPNGENSFFLPFCDVCTAGYYCVNGIRTICPVGTYSEAGATECLPVKAGCYGAREGAKTDCPSPCGTGTYTDAPGASYCRECTNKPQFSAVYVESTAMVSNNCPWVCEPGTWGSSRMGSTECKNCPIGSYCPGDGEMPYLCTNEIPDNSHYSSGKATNDCMWECDAGYFRSGQACEACNPGYTSPAGSLSAGQCTKECSVLCSANDTNACPENADCVYNTQALFSGVQAQGSACNATAGLCPLKTWTCKQGYYLSDGKCVECTDGYYCPQDDNKRYECPPGYNGSDGNRGENTDCYVSCSAKTIAGGTTTVVNAKEHYNGSAYPVCTYNVNCNAKYGASGDGTSDPACAWCEDWQYSAGGNNVCEECENRPDNSHYTGPATSNDCPWECDEGYNETTDGKCAAFCTAGVTHIHLGTGLKIPLYSSKRTTPSINVRHNGTVCYADLIEGESTGLHVKYNGKTYHAAE